MRDGDLRFGCGIRDSGFGMRDAGRMYFLFFSVKDPEVVFNEMGFRDVMISSRPWGMALSIPYACSLVTSTISKTEVHPSKTKMHLIALNLQRSSAINVAVYGRPYFEQAAVFKRCYCLLCCSTMKGKVLNIVIIDRQLFGTKKSGNSGC